MCPSLVPGLKQFIQADLYSAIFIYAVLAILVGFSVLNTQLMSVLERTREFGEIRGQLRGERRDPRRGRIGRPVGVGPGCVR